MSILKTLFYTARENIKKYEILLDIAENQLLTKSQTLFYWSHKIANEVLNDETPTT